MAAAEPANLVAQAQMLGPMAEAVVEVAQTPQTKTHQVLAETETRRRQRHLKVTTAAQAALARPTDTELAAAEVLEEVVIAVRQLETAETAQRQPLQEQQFTFVAAAVLVLQTQDPLVALRHQAVALAEELGQEATPRLVIGVAAVAAGVE